MKWYPEYKEKISEIINYNLEKYLPTSDETALDDFREICFYSMKWWKKIRSILALEIYLSISWKEISDISLDSDIAKFCFSLELIHAYSLIHDDMPCMDNDDYRRWELTTWRKYWEYKALLAWDLLNTLAYEVVSDFEDKNIAIKIVKLLSSWTWFNWMIWWQVEDLYYEREETVTNIHQIIALHNKKTWDLIKASVVWWGLLAWYEWVENFELFWYYLWLSFQIKDDLLDFEWTFEETWKSVWWEEKWFVYFLWETTTKEYLEKYLKKSRESIEWIPSDRKSVV